MRPLLLLELLILLSLFVAKSTSSFSPQAISCEAKRRQRPPSRNLRIGLTMQKKSSGMVESCATRCVNAIGSTAQPVVASAVAITLITRRDVATYLWVAGSILNAALSKILKRIINEARPEGARTADPGMPSSHAMSLFFLSVYVSVAAQFWVPRDSLLLSWHYPRIEAIGLLAYALTAR